VILLLAAGALAACAGSSAGSGLPQPAIELTPRGDGWGAEPVEDDLADVSNDGAAYTGEIDRYEITAPAAGQLVVSLSWEHDADYDLVLTGDPEGTLRLAQGTNTEGEPEYVVLDVGGGQSVYIFVAGWTGEPGPYVLETALLPPGAPLFALVDAPDLTGGWPANLPLTLTFNKDLDPDQVAWDRVLFQRVGLRAEGTWCIDGPRLTFLPRLATLPGEVGGLAVGHPYTLQLPPRARGLRAATGEYLTVIESAVFPARPPEDPAPAAPFQVTTIEPARSQPYTGGPITIGFTKAIDADTLFPQLFQVAPDSSELPLAFSFTLTQAYACDGSIDVRVMVTPQGQPPPGAVTRLRIPGTVQALGGEALGGGLGFEVDFASP